MTNQWHQNPDIFRMILELFRCHYKATEISDKLNLPYTVVTAMIKQFRKDGIKKHDRRNLSNWEGIYNDFTSNQDLKKAS